jgi:chromosome segregation ATPase
VAPGTIIDFERLRAALGGRREGVDRLLAMRQRRRALEVRLDTLERELRGQVVAQEELRRTAADLEQQVALGRRQLDEIALRMQQRLARAHEAAAEFEQVKREILELHQARASVESELNRVTESLQAEAESQRRLWHECRESTADLAQLRRSLGGVLEEAKHVLARRGEGDD